MNDEFYILQALKTAQKSLRAGEIPVGAVVVSDGGILSQAHNETVSRHDPTAHAEIVAIRKACMKRDNHRLPDCDLYVTLEPCAMCLGALVQARIKRLVFGAYDPKGGAVESIMRFPFDQTNHHVKVTSGILVEECSQILKDFFKNKR